MYVIKLDEAAGTDRSHGKAEAIAGLRKSGFPVPTGFVVTEKAMESFMSSNAMESKLNSLQVGGRLAPREMRAMETDIRDAFVSAPMPSDLRSAIKSAYGNLSLSEDIRKAEAAFNLIKAGRDHEMVAVRPSVPRTDRCFAGIADSFLNVTGEDELVRRIKMCWASFFYPRAVMYREKTGADDSGFCVMVQKMATAEKSGVMLTGFGGDKVLIEASWGLGSAVSSGMVTPDEYLLDSGGRLMEKNISKKHWMLERNEMSGVTEKTHVPGSRMDSQVLSDAEMRKLFELSQRLMASNPGQQLIDWCIGRNRVMILDIRPGRYEIGPGQEEYPTGDVLVTGRFVSKGSVRGKVKVLDSIDASFTADDIVVLKESDTRDLMSASGAGGFVTDEGGRLCNFGVLARELSVPVLSATQNATSVLKAGEAVHMVSELGKVLAVQQEEPQQPGMDGDLEWPAVPDGGIGSPGPAGEEQPGESPPEPFPFGGAGAEEQVRGMPFNDYGEEGTAATGVGSQPPANDKRTAVFSRIGPDMLGRVGVAQGLIVYQMQSQPSDIVSQAPGSEDMSVPVWAASRGESDLRETLDLARRLIESGRSEVGVLIPAIRGKEDIDRIKYQLPAGAKAGISLRTPAMAMSVESLLAEGEGLVNVELGPLVQLTMGLQKPDQALHKAVLELIEGVREKCAGRGYKVCVTMGKDYVTDWNIESLVRTGVDAICIDAEMTRNVSEALGRIQGSIRKDDGESERPAQENGQDQEGDFQLPFDFSSSFSS